ncbi:hypothetical protein M5689_017681 [Euphorbia peplus]|nr:hypothetical protein M5689_017681 [Euphorbia peplus]
MHTCLARHSGFVKVLEGINGHGTVMNEEAKMVSPSSGAEKLKSPSPIGVPLKPTNVEESARKGLKAAFEEPDVRDYQQTRNPKRKAPINN